MQVALLQSLPVLTHLTSPKYKVTWKTFLLPLIGLAVFFAYIYLFQVDIQQIIATIQRIDLSFYLLATIATLLDTLLFTLAWHALLRFLSVKISLFKEFAFVWFGIFIDTLIPAESISGEISRIYLVSKEQSGTVGKATASVVAQRLIGMGINIGTLLVGLALLLIERSLPGNVLSLIIFLVVVTVFSLMVILLLCFKENWSMRILGFMIRFAERISRGRWRLSNLREEAIGATKAFHNAMREYVHAPKTLIMAFSSTVASWVLSLAVLYFVFLSLEYSQVNWSAIIVVSSIFVALKSIPVGVPFEVGFPEITLTTLLILFGVPAGISATATILMRLLTLWLKFFVGFAAQQWVGIKVIATQTNGQADVAKD